MLPSSATRRVKMVTTQPSISRAAVTQTYQTFLPESNTYSSHAYVIKYIDT